MNDQPTNREIYAALMDLRGRTEALAWDLDAIERLLALVAELLAATGGLPVRVGDGPVNAVPGASHESGRVARVEEDIRNLCRQLGERLEQ